MLTCISVESSLLLQNKRRSLYHTLLQYKSTTRVLVGGWGVPPFYTLADVL